MAGAMEVSVSLVVSKVGVYDDIACGPHHVVCVMSTYYEGYSDVPDWVPSVEHGDSDRDILSIE